MGYLLGKKENSKVRSLLDETEKLLEEWLKKRPGNSRLLGIKAGLVGFRIGLSPMRAPFLGQRNLDAYEEAIKNNPSEPMGWLEKGNSMFHRPSMFGGDKMKLKMHLGKRSNWLKRTIVTGCTVFYRYVSMKHVRQMAKPQKPKPSKNSCSKNPVTFDGLILYERQYMFFKPAPLK
jgi:hypothetical protein